MIIENKLYYEYHPSANSLAAKENNLLTFLNNKYLKLLQRKNYGLYDKYGIASDSLLDLLSSQNKKTLIGISANNEFNIKSSIKKRFIEELCSCLIDGFKDIVFSLELNAFFYISKYFTEDHFEINDTHDIYLNYFLKRGILYKYKDKREYEVLPKELRDILNNIDKDYLQKTLNNNEIICNIGKNILCYTGVMEEWLFFKYCAIMYHNFLHRIDDEISISDLSDYKTHKYQDLFDRVKIIFNNFISYSTEAHCGYIKGKASKYYWNAYVFDPANLIYDLNDSPSKTFKALSVVDLISNESCISYNLSKFVDAIREATSISNEKAYKFADELTSYILNDIKPQQYSGFILDSFSGKTLDQINRLMEYCFLPFANKLSRWILKGHSPEEIHRKENTVIGPEQNIIRTPVRTSRIGRNDPCLCGSGKKYKKCCINKI